ncbi:testis-specific serine/threonine-protein kinase 3-like [Achroia grisella]|uniref:testis-specific serine/threonine-protein kinase 3-like n=1 Tax=Achroia grisella TaxID=688607 RepID=UPI0027D20A20|nr:testis-specific serine/threonine-protein kinase 3-like [Achroia grisella]
MPGPDIRTNDNVYGEMSTEPTATAVHSGVEAKIDRKLTVLETHGYVLGRTIGSGSYATVKVATSDRHNCQVAIKIISKFQAPGDYLKKFLPREIEVVKGLKHENLIRFLQAIETTHRVYIVMEYAENGSLLDIIRKDQHIDEMRGRRWFRQLVEAVDYCHDRGVVHRDIKCENLLMDHGLNIKLSDFGFARGHMKPKNGVFSLSETFCGSYAYASPEILKGVPYRPQDSDIWSMGVVLYAIVYGRLPFDDTNYTQLLKQVQNKVSFPREPKVSAECRKLITKVLAPLKMRVKIPQILADPWLNPNQLPKDEEVDTAQEKSEKISKEEIKSVNIGTVTFDRKLEEVK